MKIEELHNIGNSFDKEEIEYMYKELLSSKHNNYLIIFKTMHIVLWYLDELRIAFKVSNGWLFTSLNVEWFEWLQNVDGTKVIFKKTV